MSQAAITIFKKLSNLEQQVQKLKVQVYFTLPKSKQLSSLYPEEAIAKALRTTRKQIWQKKYAKKIKSLS
jgi:lambda repressor-like predicted transcriptional regulator